MQDHSYLPLSVRVYMIKKEEILYILAQDQLILLTHFIPSLIDQVIERVEQFNCN